MKWIKANVQKPPVGKDVLLLKEASDASIYYSIGHYCCRKKWVVEDSNYRIIMWSELPPLEPE